jgi:hypothetical protein
VTRPWAFVKGFKRSGMLWLAIRRAFRDEKRRPSWSSDHDWEALVTIGESLGLTSGRSWRIPVQSRV